MSIVELKKRIYEIPNKSMADKKVLAIVDSFWGCSDNWIKANLHAKIMKYCPCRAWKIAMNYVYTEN